MTGFVRARAPLRISFSGGGLSSTIDRYAYASVRTRRGTGVTVRSLDYGITIRHDLRKPMAYDGNLDLVKAAINRMNLRKAGRGIEMHLHADAPPGLGNCVGLIALVRSPDRQAYGSVTLDSDQRILSFSKKTSESSAAGWINGGVYLFEPGIFRFIPGDAPSSLERNVIPNALSSGSLIFGFPTGGGFVDIGTREGYRKIQKIDL